MENSFLYSKSISFLMGWTRPNPHCEPAPPSLSLFVRHYQVDPGAFTVPRVSRPFFLSLTHRHVGPGRQPLTASSPNPLPCPGHARTAGTIPVLCRDGSLRRNASSRLSSSHCPRNRLELSTPTATPLLPVACARCRRRRHIAQSQRCHDKQPGTRRQLLHAA
jgi:hypothetical protein